MLEGQTLFPPIEYEKNDKIIVYDKIISNN